MAREFRTVQQIELDALRVELRSLLSECTDKQRARFDKLFPAGVDDLERLALAHAIRLCQRTIRVNEGTK